MAWRNFCFVFNTNCRICKTWPILGLHFQCVYFNSGGGEILIISGESYLTLKTWSLQLVVSCHSTHTGVSSTQKRRNLEDCGSSTLPTMLQEWCSKQVLWSIQKKAKLSTEKKVKSRIIRLYSHVLLRAALQTDQSTTVNFTIPQLLLHPQRGYLCRWGQCQQVSIFWETYVGSLNWLLNAFNWVAIKSNLGLLVNVLVK